VLEESNYYAFGLKHANYNATKKKLTRKVSNDQKQITPTDVNGYKYKYNGKELQDELGLNWYDYGARMYDPALGRWFNPDPLSDFKPDQTPYRYGFNNPIGYTDPSGLYEIGTVSLTKNERKELRDKHGKGKGYRTARKAKINEKKDAIRGAISDLKDFLDSNSEISQIFQDFSGVEAGSKDWDNLFTENGKGVKINVSGEIGASKGFTEGTSGVTLNSGNSKLENMGTILHEYIHLGDNKRVNGFDGTRNGHPSYNSQKQRGAIEDVIRYSQSVDSKKYSTKNWLIHYGPNSSYHILNSSGVAVNVELGYGFEKTAFGKTVSSPSDYSAIFANYINKK
jgi:RHS repeat-associated protein